MDLNDQLKEHLNLKPAQVKTLQRLGLKTVRELLWHFPARYEEALPFRKIADLYDSAKVEVTGKVISAKLEKTWRKKLNITEISINDDTGITRAVWFHQPYLAKTLKKGMMITLSGKVSKDKRGLYFANPNYVLRERSSIKSTEVNTSDPTDTSDSKYKESRGFSSRWFRYNIKKLLAKLSKEKIEDPIPEEIIKKYKLPSLYNSLVYIHTPKKNKDAEAARKRFAFEEIFLIQLSRMKEKIIREKKPAFSIEDPGLDAFLNSLPYKLTAAQQKALNIIVKNLKGPSPMARLLEGDVGSGKTIIATLISYATIKQRYQVTYMAPTEVLARQHFKEFIERFSALPERFKIGLITSSECLKFPSKIYKDQPTHISKSQLLKWTEQGETSILIGTHSLIQDKVKFKNLALVIVDEQHRFGVEQRAKLTGKNKEQPVPHLLSMTATPIPRTLALTIYGDLDLTLLDEMPPGRKQVKTEIVLPGDRAKIYEKIRKELKDKRQVYVICPRIDEPDPNKATALNVKSVKEEAKRLKKDIFPEYQIEMLHSKLKSKEKDEIMSDFSAGKTNILVATSVIEVGVNVPNATTIIIEGAERFGLAQLHQLRGRVLRSNHQTHCYIFANTARSTAIQRLKALSQAKNGFELSELDMKLRGPGELSGKKQWGITDVGMEALKNIRMVEAARLEAHTLLQKDLKLNRYPLLKQQIKQRAEKIHFE